MDKIILNDSFQSAVSKINKELRESWDRGRVSTLSSKELKKFSLHKFIRGWLLEDDAQDIGYTVLLSEDFPYSIPRVSIQKLSAPSHSFENELPHVEGSNLLCLPFLDADAKLPVDIVFHQINTAAEFFEQYSSDKQKVTDDFKAEFISYWTRSIKKRANPILSLCELSGESRKIICTLTDDRERILVAENSEQANTWLNNQYPNTRQRQRPADGYLIILNEAPVPPFPSDLTELDLFVSQYAPDALEMYRESLRKGRQQMYIFVADGKGPINGSAKGAICVFASPNDNKVNLLKGGFTNIKNVPLEVLRGRINQSVHFQRRHVLRADHSWIHTRGDENGADFSEAKVMLIGCGSLGSHVAVRLAQMGIGSLYLVDPQVLETANVSRHALGMFALDKPKAQMLSMDLRVRFPHLNIQFENTTWQRLGEKGVAFMNDASLIVSTMAEWSGEGTLNETWMNSEKMPPVLYGWIEARAAAAHALLLQNKTSCLNCLRNENGLMYNPETTGWPNTDGIQSEPACGTLYQPYGAVDLARAEMLVAGTVSTFLQGSLQENHHFIHTTTTENLSLLGGQWTDHHTTIRPDGYQGSVEVERSLEPNDSCLFRKKHD